jgi:epoxyqueuosine reductase QueG
MDVRQSMPVGVCVAVSYPPEVIRGIADLPTAEYFAWYTSLNTLLDSIVLFGAQWLRDEGYRAIALTRESVGKGEVNDCTVLPYKTLATRAGFGWIGRCALLVNEEYGSAIRLSGILTDAPFETALPVDESRCESCLACVTLCPASALSGKAWSVDVEREELVDVALCRKVARERAGQGFGRNDVTICGKCIEVCPHTRKYLKR